MPVDHYENFPVASFLLPRRLREPVEAIYAFARSADDIADEGDASPEARLAALEDYRAELRKIDCQEVSSSPMFARLARNVAQFRLPTSLFFDLLDAFSQDVIKKRYSNFPELVDYCRRSANPVGRLLLHLYQEDSEQNLAWSDSICTSLQLVNFWQDVAIDWQKERVYLPQDSLTRFGVADSQIQQQVVNDNWRALMRFEVDRARAMMLSGAPLALRLKGRIGWELRLVVQGGLRILERIELADYNVFQHRPALGRFDWLMILLRATRMNVK